MFIVYTKMFVEFFEVTKITGAGGEGGGEDKLIMYFIS